MKPQGISSRIHQQQVPEKPRGRGGESLKSWAERSVWSLVCAMELGLISEPSLKTVSVGRLSDDGPLLKTNTVVSEEFLSINSPIAGAGAGANHSARKPPLGFAASRQGSRKGSRRRRRKRRARLPSKPTTAAAAAAAAAAVAAPQEKNVYASRSKRDRGFDRARNSTVENFWKSCKRKPMKRNCQDFEYELPETDRNLFLDETRNLDGSPSQGIGYEAPSIANVEKENLAARENCLDPVSPSGFDRDERRAKANAKTVVPLAEIVSSGRDSSEERSYVFPETNERGERDFYSVWTARESDFAGEDASSSIGKEKPTGDDSRETWYEENSVEDKDSRGPTMSTPVYAESIRGSNEKRQASTLKRSKIAPNRSAIEEVAKDAGKSDTLRPKVPRRSDEYHDTRRVTRGSRKISKENFVGKLIWGCCSGWWPALIVDADHVGMLSEVGKLWVYWIGEARISLLNEKTQIESFSCNLKHRLTQNLNVARIRAIDATMQILRKRFGCTLTKPYFAWIENNFSHTNEMLDEMKFYPYPPRIQQRLEFLKEKNAKITEKYLLDQKRESQPKKALEKTKESPQQTDVDATRLPLREQHPGAIAWAKIAGHNWWPAMIIDYRDCCMREPSFGCQWIMWYGDYKLSEVHHQLFLRFDKGIEKLRDYVNNTKKHVYLVGVLQASKDYCFRLGCDTDNWTLADAFGYFSRTSRQQAPVNSPPRIRDSVKIYDKYSAHIVKMLNESKNDPNIDDKRTDDIKSSDDFRSVTSGRVALESLCLKCLKIPEAEIETHPFFEGSLCKSCSEQYKPCMFVFGNDSKCFYCTVCAASGTVIICDNEDCPRVYCTACMKHLLCPNTYDEVLQEDPWECFLCKSDATSSSGTIVRPRADWKDKIIDMFRTKCNSIAQVVEREDRRRKIRVLSLFDGLGTGLLVLKKLGLVVDVYYASEIDPDALMVSASHFGDRVTHLGNVKHITKERIKEMAPIDLLIGGSPCNDLSLANPARLGLYDPKGTGVLFFEYCRLMKIVKKLNNGRRLFWLYENVASMPTEYRLAINKHLGQEPDVIDSADFSPQHRLRLYWHNLPIEPHSLSFQGEQDVQDILTPHCQRYALVKKIRTVTTKVNSLKQGKLALKPILMKDESDSLWITELEEIFGFPRHYTDVKNLSATKRQKLIGKSWSVQTLTAIFKSLCPFFQCNTIETIETIETNEPRS